MAVQTVQKVSRDGIGYSIVELHDTRHIFAAAAPVAGVTLAEQAEDALKTIEAVVSEHGARGSIVHQAVFVRDVHSIEQCREIMRKFYGSEMPATSYIPQPPCDGKLISIEALGVGQGTGEVEIDRRSEQLVITRHNGIAWYHAAQAVPTSSSTAVYDQSFTALENLRGLLEDAGARYDQVFRTWLYLGGIVDDEGDVERYMELNRARTDVYNDITFLKGPVPADCPVSVVPASTGIGTEGRGIIMSAIALVSDRDDIIAMPLENPRQVAAYDYGSRYGEKSPKFCRAMALSCGEYATIFISGTASITKSETRHIGDAPAQANETLENIAALISEANLSGHGLPGLGTTLEGLGLVRVYIKHAEDYPAVRAACEKRLGELPTIYVIGDVCRRDLLVELEGIAFSKKGPAEGQDGSPETQSESQSASSAGQALKGMTSATSDSNTPPESDEAALVDS